MLPFSEGGPGGVMFVKCTKSVVENKSTEGAPWLEEVTSSKTPKRGEEELNRSEV
jgi:hypothetical protein